MRTIMVLFVLSIFTSGCSIVDSINKRGEEQEKKRAEKKKEEEKAPRSSIYYGLNDYERAYVDDYYNKLDKAKRDKKKKVFGY